MSNAGTANGLAAVEISNDEIYSLETVIKALKEICQLKEFSASYYGLNNSFKHTLSEERNDYINLMDIALNKLNKLKSINNNIERSLVELK